MITSTQMMLVPQSRSGLQTRQELAMAHGVSPEVFQAAVNAAENAPDPRMERVTLAVAHLDAAAPDAHDVAQAMISCILAESGY
jgi:hypothetical protein